LEYYREIQNKGFQQILWLIDDRVTEVGVMNFFVYWTNKKGEKELVTCGLDGTILAGVMRNSVITLAKEWGIKVTERDFYIQEIIEAIKENRLIESFGTGTAAIVCPIKSIYYKGEVNKFFHKIF
jgi:branched-chain amino acid aminotransferase